jgi:hypothetical protein
LSTPSGRIPNENTTAGLPIRLVNDVSALFRNEMILVKSELMRAAAQAKIAIASMATGAAGLLACGRW